MKKFTFSGFGVQSQGFKYEIEITSAEMAEHMDIPVEKVEAMTEEEIEAYVKEKMDIIEDLVDSYDNIVDWRDSEFSCESDFYLDIDDIDEDGEE
jgi:hypothetical protein